MRKRNKSKAERAAEDIRVAYRLGQELRQRFGDRARYRAMKEADNELRELGLSPEKTRKLRQIAERYTRKELESLLTLSVKEDHPIGISFLFKTVSIPNNDGQRTRFEKEMIQKKWSRAEVDRQIRAKFGRRRDAGKRRHVPDDLLGLLTFLESECHGWLRWEDEANDKANLPEDLRKKLAVATSKIRALHVALAQAVDDARASE